MPKTHSEFLAQFDDVRRPLVAAILDAINDACPTLSEIIKWNAPSYCDDGKDRLTLMLHKSDRVGVILHTGVRPKEDKQALPLYQDDTGLLEWNSNIRATITFLDLGDFMSKRSLFQQAVQRWIEATKNL